MRIVSAVKISCLALSVISLSLLCGCSDKEQFSSTRAYRGMSTASIISAPEYMTITKTDISASGTGGPTTVSLIRKMITLTYTLNTMTAAASGSKRRRRAR